MFHYLFIIQAFFALRLSPQAGAEGQKMRVLYAHLDLHATDISILLITSQAIAHMKPAISLATAVFAWVLSLPLLR